MKTCPKCERVLQESSFSWRNKKAGTRQSWCKDCTRIRDAKSYSEGRRRGSKIEQARAIRKRNQDYVFAILCNSSCTDCGNTDPRVLEFDHLRDKVFNVAQMQSYSLKRVQEEIDKCEVVCANCHKIRTYSRLDKCYRLGTVVDGSAC